MLYLKNTTDYYKRREKVTSIRAVVDSLFCIVSIIRFPHIMITGETPILLIGES